MKSLKILLSACMYVATSAHAQALPDALKTMMPRVIDGKTRQTVPLDSLTVSEKEFLLNKTNKENKDYLVVDVSASYIDQLPNINLARNFVTARSTDAFALATGMVNLGVKAESEHRKAYVFGTHGVVGAMVTVWEFKKDGASFVLVSDLLNQNIDGMAGTLSLATNSGMTKCLWKLTISNEDILYEAVIEDVLLKNGKPSKPVASVIGEFRGMIEFTKKVQ